MQRRDQKEAESPQETKKDGMTKMETKMTIDELRARLRAIPAECDDGTDLERTHILADEALAEYIGDDEVVKLYFALAPWYA